MKIAINRCYGGFGLSHKAVMRYAELTGIELYPFTDKEREDGSYDSHTSVPYIGQDTFLIHYSTEPLTENGQYEDESYWCDSDIKRDDPMLIQVIDELGGEASGQYAKIVVVEIPDGVDWEIDEYDGLESVHETHRSWR